MNIRQEQVTMQQEPVLLMQVRMVIMRLQVEHLPVIRDLSPMQLQP